MFKRKIYDKLLDWKKTDSRECALLIDGGKNASHKSLDKFVEKFPSYVDKPYLLWMKDRKEQAGVEYLPIYMAPCLAE